MELRIIMGANKGAPAPFETPHNQQQRLLTQPTPTVSHATNNNGCSQYLQHINILDHNPHILVLTCVHPFVANNIPRRRKKQHYINRTSQFNYTSSSVTRSVNNLISTVIRQFPNYISTTVQKTLYSSSKMSATNYSLTVLSKANT